MAITDIYPDKIMGGLEGDPDPYNFNQLFNQSYTQPVGVPGMDSRAINFIDAPVPFMLRENNPALPFYREPVTNIKNIVQDFPGSIRSGFGKGIDLGKSAIGGILSLVSGIPGIGVLANMLPERDYRQGAIEDFYGDEETRALMSQIPGMENYNIVSGGLFGSPVNYGLSRAIDKRMATIRNTLEKKKSTALEQRLKALEELKAREAKALEDARNKAAAELESQRRGRRPGSGGDGPGTKDSGGPTGGYSYDSGGRQGFGYGLKKGGLVGLL
jgi:hypothetical protein